MPLQEVEALIAAFRVLVVLMVKVIEDRQGLDLADHPHLGAAGLDLRQSLISVGRASSVVTESGGIG